MSEQKVYYVYVNSTLMHEYATYDMAIHYARTWFKTNPRTRFDSITIKEMIVVRP